MGPKHPDVSFCGSCGMPLENQGDFGANADGSINRDYCHFCFKAGEFTDPDISMEQMIDRIVGFAVQMKIPEAQARDMAKTFIPTLQRWQKKK